MMLFYLKSGKEPNKKESPVKGAFSACRENDVFSTSYTVSLDIHQVSDAEKALPHA
nr:hypothetical protein P5640_21710 [Bacillus subtilis]